MTTTDEDPGVLVRRAEQLKLSKAVFERSANRLDELQVELKTHRLLVSVTTGLYEELDKLTKKAPAESITKLMCDELNQLVGDATTLMKSDPYVARVKKFVAAGEYPQNRDALLVLRTLIQGLERYKPAIQKAIEVNKPLRLESGTIFAALEHWSNNQEVADANDISERIGDCSNDWLEESDDNDYLVFSFEQLDDTDDLAKYFEELGSEEDDQDEVDDDD